MDNIMIIVQSLFWISILVVVYTYFGYGLLIYLLDKVPASKRLIPKPKNSKKRKTDEEYEDLPKVSLIISASGESKEIIREKIENTKNLVYPKEKLEIIFAIAYDTSIDIDATIDEYNKEFLPNEILTNVNSVEEELYIKFRDIEKHSNLRNISVLEKIESILNEENINSGMVAVGSKKTIDDFDRRLSLNENYRFLVTKDIERKGKISQVNRTVQKASGEIIVFSDANSMFNKEAIINLAKHFTNRQVGCVAGEKKIKKSNNSTSDEGEGFYWKYESYLKRLDSNLWSVVGAAGEIFAVRKEFLKEGVEENAIIEDFVLSMKIAQKGFRVIYEPEAYAEEDPTSDIKSEYIRRRRISAGGFQSIVWLKELLNPIKYGVLSFQYLSHRVLRWAVVPFLLPLIILLNILLLSLDNPIYNAIYVAQLIFYLFSLIGLLLEFQKIKIKIFNIPFYFSMMNFSAYAGLKRYLLGQQKVIWERVRK